MGKKRSRSVEEMERDARAVQLRAAGLSYRSMALELHVAPSTARLMVRRSLLDVVAEDVDEVRKIELARLDRYQRKVEQILREQQPVVSQGRIVRDADGRPIPDRALWLAAVDRGVRLSKRRSELLGLDVPQVRDLAIEEDASAMDAEIRSLIASLSTCPTCDQQPSPPELPTGSNAEEE